MKDKAEYMKFVNIGGKFKSYETENDLIRLQSDEIDRLNEIIKEARKRLEYYNSGEALYYVPIPEILGILDKVKK